MQNMQNDMNHVHHCTSCFTWKPIIAGALVAVGLAFLLNIFGVAIGLTAFTTTQEGIENLTLGGLLGICIGVVASMFAAGWIAGYLGQKHCLKRDLGSLYGFLAWCIALIIMVLLAHQMQQYVAYYTYVLAGTPDLVAAATTNTVATPHTITVSIYIAFSVFFLSAVSAAIGGHCGMCHKCRQSN